jgi:pentatricopeptide repeat protein
MDEWMGNLPSSVQSNPSCTGGDAVTPPGLRFGDLLGRIKSCQSISKAKELHAESLCSGLILKDASIGTALVRMYAKCGAMEEAVQVFQRIPRRNAASWTALIAGYVEHGKGREALDCWEKMRDDGVRPTAITYSCLLKACAIARCLDSGERIAMELMNRQRDPLLDDDVVLGTALVDMYSKCGALEKAQRVFDALPVRNVVTFNALITGYVHHGLAAQALSLFERMRYKEAFGPNAVTYANVLKACGMARSLEIGEGIDTRIRKEGLLEKDVVLGTALVDMYSKCGALEKSRDAFERLRVRDVVSWNALIAGYAEYGLSGEALECFQRMQKEGVRPNSVTYISASKACGLARCLVVGEQIDAEVRKQGLLQKYVALGNTLVAMYAKCGALDKAEEVFRQMPARNVVSWNALIAGYVERGIARKALECFERMRGDDRGVCPDKVTYICVLKACGMIGSLEIGEEIDAQARKQGLLREDVLLGTSLVGMYAKCGALEKARETLAQLPKRNVVSWNALLAGYAHHALGEQVLECFRAMQDEDEVHPDAVSYACALKACGILGALNLGQEIHAEVGKQGLLPKDIVLSTALLDMYSKCGALAKSRQVFEDLLLPPARRSIVPWNALIAGYAQLGEANTVLRLYGKMRTEGMMPDSITFILLLTACSHAGLLKLGEKLFDEMSGLYCLAPTLQHYACMADLFGRAGLVDKAKCLLANVSHSDRLPLLAIILGACQYYWMDLTFGRWAFEQLIQLDDKCTTTYICMQNIYAAQME